MFKKVGKTAAVGGKKMGEDGKMIEVGPTYVIRVPEDYEEKEMEEILDIALAMPSSVIGQLMVVRQGVDFDMLQDGPMPSVGRGFEVPEDQKVTID